MEKVVIEEIKKLEEERDMWKNKYLYSAADFDNYKKRSEVEKKSNFNNGVKYLALAILPVLDDFERAFNQNELAEGGKLIYKKLVESLKSNGIEKMDVEIGDNFDADKHFAVSKVGGGNQIVEEILSGYTLNGVIIRYPMVNVG